jgi:hypothetical protein
VTTNTPREPADILSKHGLHVDPEGYVYAPDVAAALSRLEADLAAAREALRRGVRALQTIGTALERDDITEADVTAMRAAEDLSHALSPEEPKEAESRCPGVLRSDETLSFCERPADHAGRCRYDQRQLRRCPTCRSKKREKRRELTAPFGTARCDDPWHALSTQEPERCPTCGHKYPSLDDPVR